MSHASTLLRQTAPALLWRTQQSARLSYSPITQQKVQTPVQSQNKTEIVHPHFQPAEGTSVQTAVQSQDPSKIAPGPTIRDARPFYTLVGGLLAGSVFVYYYWLHRKRHMQEKWEKMVKEAQEKRKASD